jgi:hypothetical protein
LDIDVNIASWPQERRLLAMLTVFERMTAAKLRIDMKHALMRFLQALGNKVSFG